MERISAFRSATNGSARRLGAVAALVLTGASWGCSSGGFSDDHDLLGTGQDAARGDGATAFDGAMGIDGAMGTVDAAVGDAMLPSDGAMRPDGSSSDMAVIPNSFTFDGTLFQGGTPSCIPVMGWWAVVFTAATPRSATLDIFFASRPTRDAVYPATATPPPGIPADRAMVVITDQPMGMVEQWHGIESGQVTVRTDGSALTITMEDMVLRGAISVPAGTPNRPVNGTILCP